MTSSNSPLYCWFDTEFTSLELDSARLLQVAMVITGSDLIPRTVKEVKGVPPQAFKRNGVSVYLQPPPGWEPGEFIAQNMPTVVDRCRASSFTVEDGDRILAAYLDAVVGPTSHSIKARPLLAGNSIHSDWFFARRDLPLFHSRLHYRLLDVSSIKTEWRARHDGAGAEMDKNLAQSIQDAFPQADLDGGTAHDAYYDAQASLAELAWYRARD